MPDLIYPQCGFSEYDNDANSDIVIVIITIIKIMVTTIALLVTYIFVIVNNTLASYIT